MSGITEQLIASGMSPAEAANKTLWFAAAEKALGRTPAKRWYVPGRIEVLGKHTDYAGGPSLLCAAERGMCAVAAERDDSLVTVSDAIRGERAEFTLAADIVAPSGWQNYVATVVRRIARNFPRASRGADIAIASDLPRSAGMSSSSVLIIAIFAAIADANRLSADDNFARLCATPENFAAYLACIENGQTYHELAGDHGVGTHGGSEDHTAILCCRAGSLSQYRFCPTRFERSVALPDDWVFVIGSSGRRANKTGSARDAYNWASLAARAVLEEWNLASGRNDPSLDAALHHAPEASEQVRAVLCRTRRADFSADQLSRRFEHYLVESELVGQATDAFSAGDPVRLGEIVDCSQSAAERLLGNQVAETVTLAKYAREAGALAASAFGAGFGGSVWALAPRGDAEQMLRRWQAEYAKAFSDMARRAEFFVSEAGPGFTALSAS